MARNMKNIGSGETGAPPGIERISSTDPATVGRTAADPEILGHNAYSVSKDDPARYIMVGTGPDSIDIAHDSTIMPGTAIATQHLSGTRRSRMSAIDAGTIAHMNTRNDAALMSVSRSMNVSRSEGR